MTDTRFITSFAAATLVAVNLAAIGIKADARPLIIPAERRLTPSYSADQGDGVQIVIETENARNDAEKPVYGGLEYIGEFKTTGYCNCRRCCGKWAGGATASGAMPKARHTVAVDPDVIPLGTRLMINGVEYVAEDTGGKWVQGAHIDIFYSDHDAAQNHGVQYADVWKVKGEQ